jgi:hypothetical protein
MARPIEWMGSGPLPADQYPPTNPFAHNTEDEEEEPIDNSNWVGSTADLPQMSRVPSYATTDPDRAPAYSRLPHSSTSRDSHATQAYEIRHAKPGLTVSRLGTDEVLYYIGRYSTVGVPDVIVYAGSTPHASICAQAKLTGSKDLQYIVGAGEPGSWLRAANVSKGGIFSSDSWHFSASQARTELAWKPTHDAHLGSGKFRSKDFKLVDAKSDAVFAVFLDTSGDDISSVGKLEFRQSLGSAESELAALAVLMAMRERSRRHAKRSGTINRSQDLGLRHAI